jgi:hypothetical protein
MGNSMTGNSPAKEGSIRLCLGCKHLSYTVADPGYDTEYTSGIGAEDASMSCAKEHWRMFLTGYGDGQLFDLENAILQAATCPDFTERKP